MVAAVISLSATGSTGEQGVASFLLDIFRVRGQKEHIRSSSSDVKSIDKIDLDLYVLAMNAYCCSFNYFIC